jgi:hypothetical protein
MGLPFFLPVSFYSRSDIDRRNRRILRKTCPIATWFATNPTWTALRVNSGLDSEEIVTNCICCGTTLVYSYDIFQPVGFIFCLFVIYLTTLSVAQAVSVE